MEVAKSRVYEGLDRALPRNSAQRVAAFFALILAVLLSLTMVSGDWTGWTSITSAIARTAGALDRSLGLPATVQGSMIHLPSRTLAVDPECTAVTLLVVYASLVLAYPLPWRTRLAALLAGAALLQVANVGRLVGVSYASELLPDRQFFMVHDYLFEVGMVFVVLIMWVVWLSIARRTS